LVPELKHGVRGDYTAPKKGVWSDAFKHLRWAAPLICHWVIVCDMA
jgi:hypothetical protein